MPDTTFIRVVGHKTVTSQVPVLRRLVAVKVHEAEASEICIILDRLLAYVRK